MKKSIILALMMGGVLTFTSCEKDKEPITNPATNQTVSTQMTDQEVEAKIKNFIAKVESGDKSTASINGIEAAWNIEAAINYGTCKAWLCYAEQQEGTISYNFDGTFTNTIETYYEILDYVNAELELIKSENKELRLLSVQFTEGTMNVNYQITFGDKDLSKNEKYINSTDWWEYGYNLGKCNGYTGSGDAATLVKAECNYQHFVLLLNPGEYFTDYQLVWQAEFPLNPNDNIQNDNYCDFLGFICYDMQANYHTCLSPNENAFYVDGLYQNANILQSNGGGLYDDGNPSRIPTRIYSLQAATVVGPGTQIGWECRTQSAIKHYPKM